MNVCACGCGVELEPQERPDRLERIFCRGHNRRLLSWNRDIPAVGPTSTQRVVIFARLKVCRIINGECWEWFPVFDGYGVLSIGGIRLHTHQWSYLANIGPLTPGKDIDHLCRNRPCWNPAHLEEVTTKVNVLRGVGPSAENSRKTHCSYGHEFSLENTRFTKRRHRVCRTCAKILYTASNSRRVYGR